MNIGTIIKKLRQERGMVQEQIAEYLNVSTQAVSRWETGSALPDITQVPALANLFNCSADILLGIDIVAKEAQIEAIAKESMNCVSKMQHEKAENMLREALKEYPNSYCLMSYLAFVLYNIRNQNEKDKNTIQTEVITLFEKVLAECTDDKYRHMAIQELCLLYSETGETEKAKSLADKMPSKFVSREYLITNTLSGAERCKHIQKEVATNAIEALRAIIFMNNNGGTYNLDECIAIHHKVLDIINILVEDGNFGDYNRLLVDAHLHLTFFNIQKSDTAVALKHFRLAAKHAIIYDTIPQTDDNMGEYTNLLFRGIKSLIHGSACPDNRSQYLLDRSSELDSYLPALELDEIKEELRKYANRTN